VTRWTKFCVRPPALYGARRSRRGLPEPSQTLKMAPTRPVTRDTVSISAKPPKCAARDGRIDRNGTVVRLIVLISPVLCTQREIRSVSVAFEFTAVPKNLVLQVFF